jgi:hypothetical protein
MSLGGHQCGPTWGDEGVMKAADSSSSLSDSPSPRVRLHSHKQKAGKDSLYAIPAGDLVAALQPCVKADIDLAVSFAAKQALWKEQRDRIDETGLYNVVSCSYAPGRGIWAGNQYRPWAAEVWPQVIEAHVMAIPRRVLPAGVSLRGPLRELLQVAFGRLAPGGLPAADRHPRHAWTVELDYEAPTKVIRALLEPWDGGQHAISDRLEVRLA